MKMKICFVHAVSPSTEGEGLRVRFLRPANIILFLFSVIFLFSSCKKENLFDCLKSTGDISTETRSIASFSEVKVYDNVNVIFVQDTLTFIELRAGENLIPLVVTELRDGKLFIENHNTCNWVRDFSIPVEVYIHLPSLKIIHSFGSGNITSQNTIVTDVIELNNHNTGDIDMTIAATEIYCRQHACFGDNKINGSAQYIYIYNTGYGFCDCAALNANRATAISISTGLTYVNTCDELSAEIKSSGDIYYKGSPVIQSTITGSGRLIHY